MASINYVSRMSKPASVSTCSTIPPVPNAPPVAIICGLTLPDMMSMKKAAIQAPEKQSKMPQTAVIADSS